jgi:hypothetical protein
VYLAGAAAESGLPYAGLHQVVQAYRCDLPRLPAPQRDLLGHLLATGQRRPEDTGLAVGAATLGLLGAAAARRPLLLAIDDAHLLDTPSREALLFVARRIAEEPIVLLLTAEHRGGAAGSALRPAVTGVPELRLGPLDPADARALLQRSAPHPLRRFVADRLLAVAEGNPLALTELPAVLTPGQCSGHLPLDDPLTPGERLRDAHLPTLARLPDSTRAAALRFSSRSVMAPSARSVLPFIDNLTQFQNSGWPVMPRLRTRLDIFARPCCLVTWGFFALPSRYSIGWMSTVSPVTSVKDAVTSWPLGAMPMTSTRKL